MTRIYLDVCCFNRPFDNQGSIRVKLETDAKLHVQFIIKKGEVELAWSYMIDFENEANPFSERRNTIEKWKPLASVDVNENKAVLEDALRLSKVGLKPKDALHIACAIEAGCQFFLTTDDLILKKVMNEEKIMVLNPTDFVKQLEQ